MDTALPTRRLRTLRMVLFLAVLVNSLDLVATAVGIHWFGNREGNPLLAGVARQNWIAFVALKGVLVPLLIVRLYRYRRQTPVLATAGMGLVTVALTVALGEWVGWMAGVVEVRGALPV
ncbi:MAG TPA: DUF5658 family protein [Candidatus Eisenbacteria bacterium]|nr:DUF5658 family protein [Candidatus Eisenbacteria bacterium]